jgi:Na+/melibiose symporter-like transporter
MIFGAVFLFITSIILYDENVILIYISLFLIGVFLSTFQVFPYSLLPDIINYYEYENKKRYEALFYGIWVLFHNLTGAIGPLFVSLTIWVGKKYFSYNLGVRFAFGVLTGFFLVISALIIIKYPITRKKYAEILSGIKHEKKLK